MLANTSPKDKTSSPTRSSYSGPTQPIPKKSLQIRTDKPRPHVCSICTRAFARLEHLKRHERSHTNEKPFQCAACGRCFARRDLVLRHQQKLHLDVFLVVRRGLLPTSLPQQIPPESTISTPTGDNIIILQNNTSNKAPLPNQLGVSSPNMLLGGGNSLGTASGSGGGGIVSGLGMLLPLNGEVSPNDYISQLSSLQYQHRPPSSGTSAHNGSVHGTSISSSNGTSSHVFLSLGGHGGQDLLTMPSPNTNSSHNTPSFNVLSHHYSSGFADLDPLQAVDGLINPDMTQQPSPVTGDSPELKEKNVKGLKTNHHQNKQNQINSNLLNGLNGSVTNGGPGHSIGNLGLGNSNNISTHHMRLGGIDRHTGSALSRTNSAYAAAQQRHASFSAVSGISYTNLQDAMTIRSTQFTEVPQQVGFATPQMTAEEIENKGFLVEEFGNLDLDWYSFDYDQMHSKDGKDGKDSSGNGAVGGNGGGRNTTRRPNRSDSFKMKLNTIPSELHLAQGAAESEFFASHIVAGHQFLDPSHPHHIKGTTPIEFGYSSYTDVASVMGAEEKSIHVGTGFAHLAHDMLDLKDTKKESPGGGLGSVNSAGTPHSTHSNQGSRPGLALAPGSGSRSNSQSKSQSNSRSGSGSGSGTGTVSGTQGSKQGSQQSPGLRSGPDSRRGSVSQLATGSQPSQGLKPAAGLRRQALSILNTDFKRADLNMPSFGSMNSVINLTNVEDLGWMDDIRELPVPSEFPQASRNTGFDGLPYINDQFEPDEIYSLFKLRQNDLVKQRIGKSSTSANSANVANGSIPGNASVSGNGSISGTVSGSVAAGGASDSGMERTPSKVMFTIGDTNEVISEELRLQIIARSKLGRKLGDSQFPPCEDLNAYLNLYEKEFNTYYPFIHMPTLKNPNTNNEENIPLILSMCAIGALYLYHDSNTLLLFNLSKFHIHNFFEKEVTVDKLQFKKVPIMAHQCLVLHIFILMFLNEPNMVEITSRQMNSMVGLIKLTNFHRPLEQFLVPPVQIAGPHDHAGIQSNFDYFIMTQTRIRTIHTFYQLEVLRSALLGCPLPMSGAEVKCGTHCNDERLWKLQTADEWFRHLQNTPGKSLVELSNNESMSSLFEQLRSGVLADTRISFSKLFALIMHVHEQILNEYNEGSNSSSTFNSTVNKTGNNTNNTSSSSSSGGGGEEIDPLAWRVNHRPPLEDLLKLWEAHFIRNGGFSLVNNHNHHLLNSCSELKLIIPMSLLAKMRLCINFTPVMTQVLYKDWPGMEAMLKKLDADTEALKEAAQYAVEVLNLWIHNISMLNDAKQTSVRTPVFFVTCIFISVVILSKVLHVIETSSQNQSVSDRAFWLSCVKVLSGIELVLSPKEESSYSEFLREESHGVFDYAWSSEFKENVENTVNVLNSAMSTNTVQLNSGTQSNNTPNTGVNGASGNTITDDPAFAIKNCKLSIQALSLGVRILADAPLWPLAMGFAEALKNMAIQFNEDKK